MLKTYRFRLYPTDEQKCLLEKHFGSVRFVYNWALNYSQEQYKNNKKFSGWMSIANSKDYKKLFEENTWLKEINRQSLNASIAHLGKAYNRFFAGKAKFPKYKSKKKSKFAIEFPQDTIIDFKHSKIKLRKFCKDGGIKCVISRYVDNGKIKICTIIKNKYNQFFISILVETNDSSIKNKIKRNDLNKDNCIGIDFGLKHFLTLSNGKIIDAPLFFKNYKRQLQKRQRAFSRTNLESKNHEKCRIRVAKIFNKIKNCRLDFIHKISTQIANDSQIKAVCVEDLNLDELRKKFGNKIEELSYNKFLTILKYKLEQQGKFFIKIGRFEPSTQICSNCGNRQKILLSQRIYNCPKCQLSIDRDLNAAINIRDFGLVKILKNTDESSEINAYENNKSLTDNIIVEIRKNDD